MDGGQRKQPNWIELSCANCLLGLGQRKLNRPFDRADSAEKGYIVPVFWVDYEGTCHNSRFFDKALGVRCREHYCQECR